MIVPVIKVVNKDAEDGFMLINESDFDPERHEKFEKPAKKVAKKAAKKKSD